MTPTIYPPARIAYTDGGGASVDLYLQRDGYDLDMGVKALGKTNLSLDGFPETDYVGEVWQVKITVRHVLEGTQTGVDDALYTDLWEFWRTHASHGKMFDFYPHWDTAGGGYTSRPEHFPKYLTECVAAIPAKESTKRADRTASRYTLTMAFTSQAPQW